MTESQMLDLLVQTQRTCTQLSRHKLGGLGTELWRAHNSIRNTLLDNLAIYHDKPLLEVQRAFQLFLHSNPKEQSLTALLNVQ